MYLSRTGREFVARRKRVSFGKLNISAKILGAVISKILGAVNPYIL